MVTIAGPEEGKTTIAVNLALAFAQKNYQVVLIDGDLRNPSIAQQLGLAKRKQGIVQVVRGQEKLEDALIEFKNMKLKILPGFSKTSNPASLIRSEEMKELIKTLKEQANVIVIDTPPSAVLSDAALYEEVADGAVMVVRQDFASAQQVQRGMETLADADLPVIGYVLNYVEAGTMGYGYSSYGKYGYGKYGYRRYGYGRHEEDENQGGKDSEEKNVAERSLGKTTGVEQGRVEMDAGNLEE